MHTTKRKGGAVNVGRFLFGRVVFLLPILLAAATLAIAQANNECDAPGEAPDLIVHIYGGAENWGAVGGISGFSLGSEICNLGTCWLNFNGGTTSHPVLGQNLFRLKNGRFEQIGQSWVKHPGGALQDNGCSPSCLPAPDGTHLGVNCSDIYNSDVNGFGTRAPKSDINAFTGEFLWPPSGHGTFGNPISTRLQVHNSDLDPSINRGAIYAMELQFIAADDASSGNAANNCSYELATVTNSFGSYAILPQGTSQVGHPAIQAWRATDPSVTETVARMPSNGVYIVSSKATYLGSAIWHYEYAVQNVNASRGARSFTVAIPSGTTVSHVGFHDVDYHDGEIHDATDWTPSVTAQSVSWTSFPDAQLVSNPLGWGTVYNFRFDADVPPGSRTIELGQFEQHAGDPVVTGVSAAAVAPSRCDENGICGPGETCGTCPDDCAAQGGGTACCGDHVCSQGENPASCFEDCGTTATAELACGDSVDNDRDGLIDCFDPDCCTDPACAPLDLDGDHHDASCDCDDANPQSWATPDEVPFATFSSKTMLFWNIPGGGVTHYDILRSPAPNDFTTDTTCLRNNPGSQNLLTDPALPPPGAILAYLVRGVNTCPNGVGPLGANSSGQPRSGTSCP